METVDIIDTIDVTDNTDTSEKLIRFDWAIKYLLRNKANFDILEGFLSELLKTSIKIQQILESESNKEHRENKSNRVDVLVTTEKKEKIIIEIQCSREWDYLSRILYGTSKVVCEYMTEGASYENISKVISINIVYFDLGTGKDYLYHGKTEFKGLHYQDTLKLTLKEQEAYIEAGYSGEPESPSKIFPEYYIIKVMAFHERVQSKLDEWIYFLKRSQVKENFDAQGLQSAAKRFSRLQLTPKERRAYDAYLRYLSDESSRALTVRIDLKMAHAEGVAEGIVEGRAEERALMEQEKKALLINFAQLLKKTGLSDSEIAVHTQLSLEEIQKM